MEITAAKSFHSGVIGILQEDDSGSRVLLDTYPQGWHQVYTKTKNGPKFVTVAGQEYQLSHTDGKAYRQ